MLRIDFVVVLSCLVMPLFHFKREMQCKSSKSCFAESVLHFVLFFNFNADPHEQSSGYKRKEDENKWFNVKYKNNDSLFHWKTVRLFWRTVQSPRLSELCSRPCFIRHTAKRRIQFYFSCNHAFARDVLLRCTSSNSETFPWNDTDLVSISARADFNCPFIHGGPKRLHFLSFTMWFYSSLPQICYS